MIIIPKPEALSVFAPLVREMIKRENARGDTLQVEPYLVALGTGHMNMLCQYVSDEEPVPLLTIFWHLVIDNFRMKPSVWIDNIFVPFPDKLKEVYTKELRDEMLEALKGAGKVLFLTDNPALSGFLLKLQFPIKQEQILYRVEVE